LPLVVYCERCRPKKVGAGPLRRINEDLMWEAIRRIQNLDPPWLHVMGALSHTRLRVFDLLGVDSADSKQWARAYTRFSDHGRTDRRELQDRFVRSFYFTHQKPLDM
jgi:hypothetical protein